MANRVYLAIDLGAESGRVMAGLWNGKTIRLEEIHRFPNGPVYLGDSLRWDVVRLWAEIQNGLALAAKKYGKAIVSVGADTWGVDYVLLDRPRRDAGPALRLPRRPHQRDDGKGLQEGASRGDLRPDRPAVHAVQHAVPVAGAQAGTRPGMLEAADVPAVHARLHPLGAVRLARAPSSPSPPPRSASTRSRATGRPAC